MQKDAEKSASFDSIKKSPPSSSAIIISELQLLTFDTETMSTESCMNALMKCLPQQH